MKKLELQLAENVEFALTTTNLKLIDETYFAYNTYVKSMQRYNLEVNEKLFDSLIKKYVRLMGE